ncbi:uncharacterized protein FA14DRAFT_116576 [Meira miltonrushii]|uniref:Flavin reductase like domain-containing protein n=1 Tax=Meira miltonrushii TaxID=1280837 RepID=A0A316VIJ8_9BASI|nr:uncharacterized protein FA14DRAFT_116576 [Meira miltonrushii]PWN37422.1 hypothetical protein FA14DRAFT_116576 [Meira miltonrushii]
MSTIADSLRNVMRTSAQPVAVITTNLSRIKDDDNQYVHGATLSSFTTVSLDPPLVAFSLRIPSRLADALTEGNTQNPTQPHFIINILSQKQEVAAAGFAKPGLPPFPLSALDEQAAKDKIKGHGDEPHPFTQIATHHSASTEQPVLVLSESIGALACSVISRHNLQQEHPKQTQNTEGSDLFLAKVHAFEKLNTQENLLPLIYWNRRFTTIKN